MLDTCGVVLAVIFGLKIVKPQIIWVLQRTFIVDIHGNNANGKQYKVARTPWEKKDDEDEKDGNGNEMAAEQIFVYSSEWARRREKGTIFFMFDNKRWSKTHFKQQIHDVL